MRQLKKILILFLFILFSTNFYAQEISLLNDSNEIETYSIMGVNCPLETDEIFCRMVNNKFIALFTEYLSASHNFFSSLSVPAYEIENLLKAIRYVNETKKANNPQPLHPSEQILPLSIVRQISQNKYIIQPVIEKYSIKYEYEQNVYSAFIHFEIELYIINSIKATIKKVIKKDVKTFYIINNNQFPTFDETKEKEKKIDVEKDEETNDKNNLISENGLYNETLDKENPLLKKLVLDEVKKSAVEKLHNEIFENIRNLNLIESLMPFAEFRTEPNINTEKLKIIPTFWDLKFNIQKISNADDIIQGNFADFLFDTLIDFSEPVIIYDFFYTSLELGSILLLTEQPIELLDVLNLSKFKGLASNVASGTAFLGTDFIIFPNQYISPVFSTFTTGYADIDQYKYGSRKLTEDTFLKYIDFYLIFSKINLGFYFYRIEDFGAFFSASALFRTSPIKFTRQFNLVEDLLKDAIMEAHIVMIF